MCITHLRLVTQVLNMAMATGELDAWPPLESNVAYPLSDTDQVINSPPTRLVTAHSVGTTNQGGQLMQRRIDLILQQRCAGTSTSRAQCTGVKNHTSDPRFHQVECAQGPGHTSANDDDIFANVILQW